MKMTMTFALISARP